MTHTTVALHHIRAEQLRQIARHRGVLTTDVLDGCVRQAWQEIGEGPTLPGFGITAGVDHETGAPEVIFDVRGTMPIEMTPGQTRDVARGLQALLDGSVPRFEVEAVYADWRASILGARKGRGFTLKVNDNLDDESRVPVMITGLTRSLTEDLAACFLAHADKAEALAAA